MLTQLNPYIHFKDNTRQAMEFYQSVFGGKLDMDTFEKFNVSQDPAENSKIMHAMLKTEKDMILMASDTPNSMEYKPGVSVSLTLNGDNEQELTEYWNKLSEGGTVTMPLNKAPWGDSFGMFTDKFGVNWMINITGKTA